MRKLGKYIIILICGGLIIARLFYPNLNFDSTSLILLGMIFILILIPNPEELVNRTKKFKFGNFEFELNELNQETEKIETRITEPNKQESNTIRFRVAEKIDEKVVPRKDDPIELIRLSIEIEQLIKSIFLIGLKDQTRKPLSIQKSISILEDEGLMTFDTSFLLRKFWNIRNEIVHNDIKMSQGEMMRFIDIGLRIIRILKTIYEDISSGKIEPK